MGRALRLSVIILLVNALIGHAASSADPQKAMLTPQQSREVVPSADGYTCVMHPEVRTAKPGKCPKCQMTLVPVTPDNPDAFDRPVNVRNRCNRQRQFFPAVVGFCAARRLPRILLDLSPIEAGCRFF